MTGRTRGSQRSHVGRSRGWRREAQAKGIACAKVLRQKGTVPLKKLTSPGDSRLTGAEEGH